MRFKRLLEKYEKMPAAARASFWYLICNILQKAITMLTIPIITRMLSTSEYGVYSVFNSYSNILIIFGTLYVYGGGYNVGMKKYKEDGYRYTSSVAGLILLITTLIFALFWTVQDWITATTGLGRTACVLMFVWVYGQGAINLWFIENRYEFKYRWILVGTLFIVITTPILKIAFIDYLGKNGMDKSLGAIWGYVLPVAVLGCMAWLVMFTKGKSIFVKEYWKFVLIFNIPLIPYYLSQILLNHADRIMIERLDSTGSAGIYSVAYSLAMAISIINTAVSGSFTPWQYQQMEAGNCKYVAKIVNLVMFAVAVFHLILIFAAPEIMKVFAAPEYMEAIYVVPPVTIGVLISWLTTIFLNVEFFYEKNKALAVSSVISAAANIVLNAIAIPRFGYLAAGYTTLICYLINMIFHGIVAIRLSRRMGVECTFETNKIALLTAGCIIAMFVIMFLYEYAVVRYGILLVLGMITFANRKKLKLLLTGLWGTVRKKEA